jgi:signal transduction histidine kinase
LGVRIEFSVTEKEIYAKMASSVYKFKLSDTLYKIIKEAITNSVRHGCATEINIIVKFSLHKANLFIIDNGCGCREIIEGFGLAGMKQRVEELNGIIKFGSDGESGFNIHVELPMEAAPID